MAPFSIVTGLLVQATLVGSAPPRDTLRVLSFAAVPRTGTPSPLVMAPISFERLASTPMADTGKRAQAPVIEYSEIYATRVAIHRALSWAMVPLFIGSGYTGFVLRKERDQAPKWVRDIHGPLAAGTIAVFGMNALTGVWNLWEGRKEPENRTKRLVHGALFLVATAGFTYVTTAGDNIHQSGKPNHWHRDVALASMGLATLSWTIMAF